MDLCQSSGQGQGLRDLSLKIPGEMRVRYSQKSGWKGVQQTCKSSVHLQDRMDDQRQQSLGSLSELKNLKLLYYGLSWPLIQYQSLKMLC